MQNDRLSNIHGIQSYCEYQTEAATPFGTQNIWRKSEKDHPADAVKYETTQCIVSAGLQRLNDDALFELGSDISSPDLNRTRSMRGLPVFFIFD
ncbi:hypothetical protein BOTNAR_0599g00020 [Botryotinia narcissicola]|uniref:Uncharacterized protein n=1 Tax=Botryotinia narcissicola TaxID=278944 RepID=A0A4Z1HMQ1_9HELO|nr:hypothetical protein BOTNAR_0599g00020 [Botryotinia narcissicola]